MDLLSPHQHVGNYLFKTSKGSGVKCGDGSSVGLFIPLPIHLAKKFPSLLPEDSSPSHVTLLIVGEVEEEKRDLLLETLSKTFSRFYWNKAEASLGDLDYFDHGHRVVPHVCVDFNKDFASFRRVIKQDLEHAGFPLQDKYVEYKPHVTLDYLDPEEEWESRVPKGKWVFDQIEVWGLPDVHKIQLGKVRKAQGNTSTLRGAESMEMSSRIRALSRRMANLEKEANRSIKADLDSQMLAVDGVRKYTLRWIKDLRGNPLYNEVDDLNEVCMSIILAKRSLQQDINAVVGKLQSLSRNKNVNQSERRVLNGYIQTLS